MIKEHEAAKAKQECQLIIVKILKIVQKCYIYNTL